MHTDEPSVFSGVCPARELLDRLADKWTALVIGVLSHHGVPVRFTELRRAVGGISQKMLTQTLRDMERDGLVVRTVYSVMPPRVEYAISPLGQTVIEPLTALSAWAQAHMPQVRVAQQAFDHRAESVAVAWRGSDATA